MQNNEIWLAFHNAIAAIEKHHKYQVELEDSGYGEYSKSRLFRETVFAIGYAKEALDALKIFWPQNVCETCKGQGKYYNNAHAGDFEPSGVVACQKCGGVGLVENKGGSHE